MTTLHSCDYCGELITDDLMVEFQASGSVHSPDRPSGRRYVAGDIGHYHATEDQPCWAEMFDRVRLIHAVSSDLGPDREALERRIDQRAERGRERAEQSELMLEHKARMRGWQRRPQGDRDRLLLDALGEDCLTIRELTARLNAALDSPQDRWPTVYESTVAKMARRLLSAGEFERIGEPFKGKVRYRYFRCRGQGPTAELERAYRGEAGEAA
jgi:hypothetical protein